MHYGISDPRRSKAVSGSQKSLFFKPSQNDTVLVSTNFFSVALMLTELRNISWDSSLAKNLVQNVTGNQSFSKMFFFFLFLWI